MAESNDALAYQPPKVPDIHTVTVEDIRGALSQGWSDFRKAPLFGLFFGGIYTLGGLAILASLTVLDMHWMIIPLAIGFPLIGPLSPSGSTR